jgi:anti-sigma regulatory factor (Ser/Thr protein kinase)
MSTCADAPSSESGFRHEAFLYDSPIGFRDGALSFIHAGISSGEAVLVVVDHAKIALLRAELDGDADRVLFADVADVGRNPARIIPVWQKFVAAHAPTAVRGIGEPIWAERTPAEVEECQIHESLLNIAFAATSGFRLLCPYDANKLPLDVIEAALRSHPHVRDQDGLRDSHSYRGVSANTYPFDMPLPEPNRPPLEHLGFGADNIGAVRIIVAEHATASGLGRSRVAELAQCVHEAAVNSVRHGGGAGTLRVWRDDATLVCEVSDAGQIERALVGRELPPLETKGGRGLWLVQQLSDLAQLRSGSNGTVVRIHAKLS